LPSTSPRSFANIFPGDDGLAFTLEQFDGRSPANIHIIGKGRRERVLPLWQETAAAIRAWIAVRPKDGDTALFVRCRMVPSPIAPNMALEPVPLERKRGWITNVTSMAK